MAAIEARRWFVTGRVQGVGFREFVRSRAVSLNLAGWTSNLSDGRVEVVATGPRERLEDLAAALHKGPPLSGVRSVEQMEAVPARFTGFEIR